LGNPILPAWCASRWVAPNAGSQWRDLENILLDTADVLIEEHGGKNIKK
jgi:hypothetical protein